MLRNVLKTPPNVIGMNILIQFGWGFGGPFPGAGLSVTYQFLKPIFLPLLHPKINLSFPASKAMENLGWGQNNIKYRYSTAQECPPKRIFMFLWN